MKTPKTVHRFKRYILKKICRCSPRPQRTIRTQLTFTHILRCSIQHATFQQPDYRRALLPYSVRTLCWPWAPASRTPLCVPHEDEIRRIIGAVSIHSCSTMPTLISQTWPMAARSRTNSASAILSWEASPGNWIWSYAGCRAMARKVRPKMYVQNHRNGFQLNPYVTRLLFFRWFYRKFYFQRILKIKNHK